MFMFKQLFDESSSTLTYLVVDDESKEAVIIDPVRQHVEEYLRLVIQLNLQLKYALETHVHADHVTASGQLRNALGVQVAVSEQCGAINADRQLNDGDEIVFGKEVINVIATPGHTAGSLSFLWRDRIFTGDALLIDGCGRTDFQGGDAGALFDSIIKKVFTLPDETLIYPGHDYQGHRVSNVGQEKLTNSRLANKSREEFIGIMNALDLPKPKLIEIAVPANRFCGVDETGALQG
jgi:sulfur dioxygenase